MGNVKDEPSLGQMKIFSRFSYPRRNRSFTHPPKSLRNEHRFNFKHVPATQPVSGVRLCQAAQEFEKILGISPIKKTPKFTQKKAIKSSINYSNSLEARPK